RIRRVCRGRPFLPTAKARFMVKAHSTSCAKRLKPRHAASRAAARPRRYSRNQSLQRPAGAPADRAPRRRREDMDQHDLKEMVRARYGGIAETASAADAESCGAP